MADQFTLFDSDTAGPPGFLYRPEFLSRRDERELADAIAALPLQAFEFHGFLGKRRTQSFGWHYAFDGSGLRKAEDIPPFLLPLRDRAAHLAGLPADMLQHVLVTEYAPGAGIGWHKDRPVFEDVVGISLLSAGRLRFRRRRGDTWERASLIAEPRSAYLLRGPARIDWEHSLSPVETLRYSITFRSFRDGAMPVTDAPSGASGSRPSR